MDKLKLGTYPTALERLPLNLRGAELWIKRDDLTHAVYGGNKVRKLEYLLGAARARGARRLVTVGAAGSHHVLATVVHGRAAGFEVAAVMTAQPRSPGVMDNLRAGLGRGLEVLVSPSYPRVPWVLARAVRRGDFLIAPGGSSVTGSMGYLDAVRELAAQIKAGEMPEPDVIVVALGSGGTAAGIAAGVAACGLRSRVLGVYVVEPSINPRPAVLMLARAVCWKAGVRAGVGRLAEVLETDDTQLGNGYGYATREGDEAKALASAAGLMLDDTYTAKAFAGALRLARERSSGTVLFWHTLSSAPMGPLLEGAPREEQLAAEVRALVV